MQSFPTPTFSQFPSDTSFLVILLSTVSVMQSILGCHEAHQLSRELLYLLHVLRVLRPILKALRATNQSPGFIVSSHRKMHQWLPAGEFKRGPYVSY